MSKSPTQYHLIAPAAAKDDPKRATLAVQVGAPIGHTLTYAAAGGQCEPSAGKMTLVPLGSRQVVGVIWSLDANANAGSTAAAAATTAATATSAAATATDGVMSNQGAKSGFRLRAIKKVYPHRPLTQRFMAWIDWVARYIMAPRGAVLDLAVRKDWLEAIAPRQTVYHLSGESPPRMTKQRRAVLDVFASVSGEGADAGSVSGVSLAHLCAQAGVSEAVIRSLVKQGCLTASEQPRATTGGAPPPPMPTPTLSATQAAVVKELNQLVELGEFVTYLLDGVTGSGKTEVYFAVIERVLASGGQVLVLLPEIILTTDLFHRFASRLRTKPKMWHARIGARQKGQIWRAVQEGEPALVIGARSALFLPFANLGMIVVDEEHDASYKQDDGISYNARDLAVARGKHEDIVVVLSSATPSLETLHNAQGGKYRRGVLPARHGTAVMPKVDTIDIREHPPQRDHWITPPLAEAITLNLNQSKQTLLFLNRRGYAPLVQCRSCGARLNCRACDAWLSEHHRGGIHLMCHICGAVSARPRKCPHCGAEDALHAVGPGVERLCEEVKELFPTARLLVMSSDTLRTPNDMQQAIDSVAAGDVDIVVGTQIAAKGHNFSGLTLVGVIDGDYALSHQDLRASERCFQLMVQVIGRAGRVGGGARALVQTAQRDHPLMQAIAALDRDGFVRLEMQEREAGRLPPFGRLAAVVLSHDDAEHVQGFARAANAVAPMEPPIKVLGPVPAPIARIKHQYRWRFMVHSPSGRPLQGYLKRWLQAMPEPTRGLRVRIDIDPINFY